MSDAELHDLEEQLAAQMVGDYTRSLLEEPILPPPPSHADGNTQVKHTVYMVNFRFDSVH